MNKNLFVTIIVMNIKIIIIIIYYHKVQTDLDICGLFFGDERLWN